MPKYVYVNPANPKQKVLTTQLGLGVPAGYVLTNTSDGSWQGVDGVVDDNSQKFVGGQASGGFPTYYGYSDGLNTSKNPNGILGG